MPDYLGADQRKTKEEEKEDKPIRGQVTEAGVPGGPRSDQAWSWGRGWIPVGRSVLASFCAAGDLIWGCSRINPPTLSVSFIRSKLLRISR